MRNLLRRALVLGTLLWLPALASAQERGKTRVDPKPKDSEPCCSIVAINVVDALVSARETASGYTFKFKVSDKKLLATLKVGDNVWADFSTKKVRLRKADSEPCCNIVLIPNNPPSQP
jgi:hypothetical protein